jgi:hypothetical protein
MHRRLAVALALVVPASLAAQEHLVQENSLQEHIDRRMALAPDAAIRLQELVGTVRLVGWDRDSLVVTGSLPAGTGKLYVGGSRAAAKVALEGAVDSSALVNSATLEIRVPRGARISVRGASVSIDAGDITGELDFTSARGRLRLEGAPRRITAETLDGNVEIVGTAASTRVRTASGAITLRGLTGDLLATSVSGAIRIGGARVTQARLETVSGEISWKGAIAHGGVLQAQTMSGDIELRLPPGLGADLELTAPSGGITSEWSLVRPAGRGTVRSSIGDGGAAVIARTFKGRISLVKQPEVDINLSVPAGISDTNR